VESSQSFLRYSDQSISPLAGSPLDLSTGSWPSPVANITGSAGSEPAGASEAPPALNALPALGSWTIVPGGEFSIALPPGSFSHRDGSAIIEFEARLDDGQPLPDWLHFDPRTGLFTGKVPAEFSGKLSIKVTARDAQGNEAATELEIDTSDEAPSSDASPVNAGRDESDVVQAPATARPGLTEQLQHASKRSTLAPGLAALSLSVQAARNQA
jgi:hypothetical protein